MTTARTLIAFCALTLFCIAAPAQNAPPPQPSPPKVAVNIDSLPIRDALKAFGEQTGLQVLFRSEDLPIDGVTTPRVAGEISVQEALQRLLVNTGLKFEFVNQHTVRISAARPLSSIAAPDHPPSRLAQAESRSGRNPDNAEAANVPTSPPSTAELDKATLEEIVVTGSHIRGATDLASPVLVYTRADIDQTGLGTVQAFIQSIPQNFNGGASDSTVASVAGGGNAANAVGGTGVNLRGLGNDSTLVLVNGQRVAPGNTSGNFVDISLIPLSAVERIEIVTDGASAIYGSDAVGGVVNFILRRDLDGAETRVRYGTDAQGGTHETELGQTIGTKWSDGSALLSYEYLDRTPLTGADRSYTQALVEPFTLLPVQVRHGAFLTADQTLAPGIDTFLDATFSHRSTDSDVTSPFFGITNPVTITAYSGTLGTKIDLPHQAQAQLSATYASSSTRATEFFDSALADDQKVHSSVLSLDAKVDGTLGAMPAGPVRYAVGAQFRQEKFDDADLVGMTDFKPQREVTAAFIELRLPLVGPPAGGTERDNRLALSLADRDEHFSDFGSTNNPQLGLIWKPSRDLLFRGAVGTSFHAPLLNDLNPVPDQVVPYPEFNPRTGGATNTLIEFGGNPDLQPEKATTWTLGLDLHPEEIPGLRGDLSYYNIRFKNRIANAQLQGIDVSDALRLYNVLGPEIVQFNPPQSLVRALAATPGYADVLGTGITDLSTIGAIVDSRWHNLSTQKTSGMDFDLSYAADSTLGKFDTGIAGTYILTFKNQFTAGSPTISVLNTVYNPADLKVRAHELFTHGPFSAALFINYVNSYKDNRTDAVVPVASWTTVDATLSYRVGHGYGLLNETSFTLGVINIANKNPPYVAPQYPGEYGGAAFDGANASVLGRYFSLQLSKNW
jgi:iron complex outermembrane receptor protein